MPSDALGGQHANLCNARTRALDKCSSWDLQGERAADSGKEPILGPHSSDFLTALGLTAYLVLSKTTSSAATRREGRSKVRLIKMFGLAALAAVAAMAFVGATSASASASTQICTEHTGLTCAAGKGSATVHQVLAAGTVGELLALIDVLCLSFLVEATALGLGNPQSIHATSQTFSGCGTGSAHNNCTVTVQEQPLSNLLKTGLDEGVLTATNGRTRLQCSNIGLDCVYDLEGIEFAVGGGHLTANETATNELGGKFFCPDEGLLDALLETLGNAYVLG
ncbi:MAG TPA: hypothetical protein VID51_02655 [Solirubrobacterales bacterium]